MIAGAKFGDPVVLVFKSEFVVFDVERKMIGLKPYAV